MLSSDIYLTLKFINMKKFSIFGLMALLTTFGFAQDEDTKLYGAGTMPFNDAGEVVFTKVVQADGFSADDLYTATRIYITEAFKSANDVIQLDDKDNKTLIAKGWREQKAQSGFMNAFAGAPYQVYFTIKIQCRDNRYKIDVYQLKGHQNSHSIGNQRYAETNVPAEILTDEMCIKPNGKVKTSGNGFWRRIIIDAVRATITQAEDGISRNLSGGVSSGDDW